MTLSDNEIVLTVAISMAVTVVFSIISYHLGKREGFYKGKIEGVKQSNKRIFEHFSNAIGSK